MDTLEILAITNKGDNFCDFLSALQYTKPLLKRGLILYGKNLLPFFLFRINPFQKGGKIILAELPPSLKSGPIPIKRASYLGSFVVLMLWHVGEKFQQTTF